MKDETAQPEETQDEERVEEPAEELPPGSITEPAKLLRIVSMVRELLEETRQTTVDERGRAQLRQIYERSLMELRDVLSPDLQQELQALAIPMEGVPTES